MLDESLTFLEANLDSADALEIAQSALDVTNVRMAGHSFDVHYGLLGIHRM
jgi:hypothetical protein